MLGKLNGMYPAEMACTSQLDINMFDDIIRLAVIKTFKQNYIIGYIERWWGKDQMTIIKQFQTSCRPLFRCKPCCDEFCKVPSGRRFHCDRNQKPNWPSTVTAAKAAERTTQLSALRSAADLDLTIAFFLRKNGQTLFY